MARRLTRGATLGRPSHRCRGRAGPAEPRSPPVGLARRRGPLLLPGPAHLLPRLPGRLHLPASLLGVLCFFSRRASRCSGVTRPGRLVPPPSVGGPAAASPCGHRSVRPNRSSSARISKHRSEAGMSPSATDASMTAMVTSGTTPGPPRALRAAAPWWDLPSGPRAPRWSGPGRRRPRRRPRRAARPGTGAVSPRCGGSRCLRRALRALAPTWAPGTTGRRSRARAAFISSRPTLATAAAPWSIGRRR